MFIAFCFDLPNPYWALTIVYIVAHALSGASTSKAVYRLMGTVVGGAMTVILFPNLVNSPELLTLGISLWMATCLALSLLDRSPRSYAFMLGWLYDGVDELYDCWQSGNRIRLCQCTCR